MTKVFTLAQPRFICDVEVFAGDLWVYTIHAPPVQIPDFAMVIAKM